MKKKTVFCVAITLSSIMMIVSACGNTEENVSQQTQTQQTTDAKTSATK